MSRTRKPCPGCGEIDRYRPATEVCESCRELMDAGREFHERLRAEAETGERRAYGVAPVTRDHDWPRIFAGGGFSNDPARAFARAFSRLVRLIGEEIPTKLVPQDKHDVINGRWEMTHKAERAARRLVPALAQSDAGRGSLSECVLLLPEVARALSDLYASANAIAVRSQRDGEERGYSILTGLATGRLSVGEFNEATHQADKHGRRW